MFRAYLGSTYIWVDICAWGDYVVSNLRDNFDVDKICNFLLLILFFIDYKNIDVVHDVDK